MKLISHKLRDSARGQACTLRLVGACNYDSTTTVFAHLPRTGLKGMGMKIPDMLGVHACSGCHDVIDGRAQGEFTAWDLLRAQAETMVRLVEMGIISVAGADARANNKSTARPSKILPRRGTL